ncbi:MAG TPA: ABC transporter permease [Steroidobacteraceae bacterium]|nr:ABC transporter permease [Steroidobacteraceae bacterium]
MSGTLQLALRSLANRRTTVLLTLASIAVSVSLLLGVQKLRGAAREGFTSTVSGVDLIVGARSGPLNLLLYSVFRVGDATANVSWDSYQLVANHRDVAWTIPISLGDSHRGFRVLGTTDAYFEHYRIAGGRPLRFLAGTQFADLHDVVLGADVAEELRYVPGEQIVIAHGAADVSFTQHDDHPFRVVGILERTGTPVDRTVHVSLDAMAALHAENATRGITAFMVGMRDRTALLTMQRALNEYRKEPLLAIIPGVALKQLWDLVAVADRALMVVAAFVVFAGLLGMLTTILVSLNERRREMAILRSVGAAPRHIFTLMVAEAGILATAGVLAGIAITYTLLAAAQPLLAARFGIFVALTGLTAPDFFMLAGIVLAALVMGLLPAWRAYRNTLADGLTIRI